MGFRARGLAFRVSLYLTAALAVFLGFFGFWAAERSHDQLEETVIRAADRVSDVIRRATRSFMFRNERREIFEIIHAIGQQSSIERIRIYDPLGGIRYSTDSTEVGREVDKSSEACVSCHQHDSPPHYVHPSERFRIFHEGEARILGMILPIENDSTCSGDPCHVHPADQRILGVLDVQMSLAAVDHEISHHLRNMAIAALLILFGLVVISNVLLYRQVYRPVRSLIGGTRKIAAGDLSSRIPVRSNDEIGDLAVSFNEMTEQLAQARSQSEAWARTLEERVEEKSRALEKVQREVLQMEKMVSMGKLAAIVAHEVNNPLAGIRTYARLLRKKTGDGGGDPGKAGPLGGEASQILEMIETEATRCGEIVKHLLQFSRPSRPRTEPVDLNDLIRGSMRLVQHQIDLKGLQGDLDLADDLPRVICDPQQIRQALVAVLINACEAMGSEGTISVSSRAGEEGRVVLSVSDTGTGMDEETQKHIFEPFYTTKDGGGGLGLAVVYGIIRSHGGKVAVYSTPGVGTTIRFHLPVTPPATSPEPEEGVYDRADTNPDRR